MPPSPILAVTAYGPEGGAGLERHDWSVALIVTTDLPGDDPIHAKVDDKLAIVIGPVPDGEHRTA